MSDEVEKNINEWQYTAMYNIMAGREITYSVGKCSSKCFIGISDTQLGRALHTNDIQDQFSLIIGIQLFERRPLPTHRIGKGRRTKKSS